MDYKNAGVDIEAGYKSVELMKKYVQVKKLVDDCYTDAKRILTENMDVLHSCANLLLEKERISREEFEALFKNDKAAEENL